MDIKQAIIDNARSTERLILVSKGSLELPNSPGLGEENTIFEPECVVDNGYVKAKRKHHTWFLLNRKINDKVDKNEPPCELFTTHSDFCREATEEEKKEYLGLLRQHNLIK